MANYNYDEAGNMAAYFLITFLFLVLVPLSLSVPSSIKQGEPSSGCECRECVEHRSEIRKRESGGLFNPKLRRKTIILVLGWSLFAFLAYKVATTDVENKVYNPFEVLGIGSGTSIKDIKSHYKKLSRKYHPDKVRLAVNETIEAVEAHFVAITKAYKSLTDETIKQNWERYGHPDGRQEVSMGIALPKWIVEGKNNIWVLGVYGIIFGAALPAMVGRWWFGNRQKTKDGVDARSAATYFKMLSEESGVDDVVCSLGKSFEWERPNKNTQAAELDSLETRIAEKLQGKWASLRKLAEAVPSEHESRRKAFILLYAHFLRLSISNQALRQEQADILLQTPTLLNALLNISTSRSWLIPTLAAMRLHAYLAQAIIPGRTSVKFAQLPGITEPEAEELAKNANALEEVVKSLEEQSDDRTIEVKKALSKWGKLELVDAAFKVIGERVVVPSSIVYLVVKLRLSPPSMTSTKDTTQSSEEEALENEKDEEFLSSRKDAEDLPEGVSDGGWAHAPYWPANRKPGWWLVLADDKSNRVVVPPMKITDVPFADPRRSRDYRSYKLQFQAPPSASLFAWKLYLISDTHIGEEVTREVTLRIEDVSALEGSDQAAEDEISEPEEDSLAGQMAMMRGGSVKKARQEGEGDSDEESSTDDDRKSDDDDSSSDSD